MEHEFLNSVEGLINSKRYELELHKQASKIAKEGLKKNNYIMTNTELLYFHEVEILMLMSGLKKIHDKVKWQSLENIALLSCIVILAIAFIFK